MAERLRTDRDSNHDVRPFGRRIALGLGGFVLGSLVLGQRSRSTATPLGCGKSDLDDGRSIEWIIDPDVAKTTSTAARKLILVFVGAEWDAATKEFELRTFSDREVRAVIHAKYVALRVDATNEEDRATERLLSRFRPLGVPTIVLYTTGFDREIDRLNEYTPPHRLLAILQQAVGRTTYPRI